MTAQEQRSDSSIVHGDAYGSIGLPPEPRRGFDFRHLHEPEVKRRRMVNYCSPREWNAL